MKYILAIFLSRTQTMAFYNRLKARKIPCSIINNPRATNVTCGICVKFYPTALGEARAIINNNTTGFAGFFTYIENFPHPIVFPLR